VNFEDERYVRVYTRKTVTSKLLGWEGRMCLHALLLEVDRAGVLDLDGMDPADALAALSDIPVELARVGMGRMLERGVVQVAHGRLYVPRFIEAQETRQSDAQRQRESRGRRAAELRSSEGAVRAMAEPVTIRDDLGSQNVTDCHTQSPAVTVGHSVLCLAVPSSAERETPVSPRAGDDGSSAEVVRVFEGWKQATGHAQASLDRKRTARIKARLREKFTPEQLIEAIGNAKNDPFLMGSNDTGRVYDGLETLLRDAAQVERLLALNRPRVPGPGGKAPPGSNFDRLKARAERFEAEERQLGMVALNAAK
jgi:hypothetical protein